MKNYKVFVGILLSLVVVFLGCFFTAITLSNSYVAGSLLICGFTFLISAGAIFLHKLEQVEQNGFNNIFKSQTK